MTGSNLADKRLGSLSYILIIIYALEEVRIIKSWTFERVNWPYAHIRSRISGLFGQVSSYNDRC